MASPSTTNDEIEPPIRVTVTPAQSSYFAGEVLSVTVTFKNVRPSKPPAPVIKPKSRASSLAHKRASHSISSAPLPRPPTSPGTPRTVSHHVPKRSSLSLDGLSSRKGLIGRGSTGLGMGIVGMDLAESRMRKKLLSRSLSVAISSPELAMLDLPPPHSASVDGSSFPSPDSATAPIRPASAIPRRALQLSSDHPHARKTSVLDGQAFQLQDILSPSSASTTTTSILSPYPTSPATSASASTFSLALDPISELSSPNPNASTLSFAHPRIEDAFQHSLNINSSSSLHLPHPFSPTASPLSPYRSVSNPNPFPLPQTELILYSYAQLNGSISLVPLSGSMEQYESMNRVRSALLRKSVIGGGSMDITPSLAKGLHAHAHHQHLRPSGKRTHGRAVSFSSSLLSLIYPPSGASSGANVNGSTNETPHRRPRAPSVTSSLSLPNSSSGSLGQNEDSVDSEDSPLPTLEMQPAMLAVDLMLQPGEERSYTYSVKLPDVLPPTYKGRTLKISYELVVGTCRAQGGKGMGANGISRVMKMPIRVYNHVAVGQSQKPYDLLWPISHRSGRDKVEGRVCEANNQGNGINTNTSASVASAPTGSMQDLGNYASALLESTRRGSVQGVTPDAAVDEEGAPTPRAVHGFEQEREREREEAVSGREAVEVMTRISKKVSYDVNKDGQKVAVLTFTKSAYRLGETIHGVVEINERLARSRVLELAVYLESQESLPASISATLPQRQSRRVHAEHFSNHAMNSLRTTFALDIPSDASPAFKISTQSIAKPSLLPNAHIKADLGSGGLEWRVRLCLHVGAASPGADRGTEGVVFKALERDGEKGEWGSSWRALPGLAPLERIPPSAAPTPPGSSASATHSSSVSQSQSWSSFIASALLGTTAPSAPELSKSKEGEDDWDGIKPDLAGGVGQGVIFTGEEEGWRAVKMETVECEVPVRVWPGHTPFKPMDVVFDV